MPLGDMSWHRQPPKNALNGSEKSHSLRERGRTMSAPISLRNIPPDTLKLAHALSAQTGLSLNAVFRLALTSGLLVELTKVTPEPSKRFAGLEAAYLAKVLRRHLSSAIDLLVEYEEHPYQAMMGQGERSSQDNSQGQPQVAKPTETRQVEERHRMAESAIGDDLEMLGIGMGLAETV